MTSHSSSAPSSTTSKKILTQPHPPKSNTPTKSKASVQYIPLPLPSPFKYTTVYRHRTSPTTAPTSTPSQSLRTLEGSKEPKSQNPAVADKREKVQTSIFTLGRCLPRIPGTSRSSLCRDSKFKRSQVSVEFLVGGRKGYRSSQKKKCKDSVQGGSPFSFTHPCIEF